MIINIRGWQNVNPHPLIMMEPNSSITALRLSHRTKTRGKLRGTHFLQRKPNSYRIQELRRLHKPTQKKSLVDLANKPDL